MKISKLLKRSLAVCMITLSLVAAPIQGSYSYLSEKNAYAAEEVVPQEKSSLITYYQNTNGKIESSETNKSNGFGQNGTLNGWQTYRVGNFLFGTYYTIDTLGWLATKEPIDGINSGMDSNEYEQRINDSLNKVDNSEIKFFYNTSIPKKDKDNFFNDLKTEGYNYFYMVDKQVKASFNFNNTVRGLAGKFNPSYNTENPMKNFKTTKEDGDLNYLYSKNNTNISDDHNNEIELTTYKYKFGDNLNNEEEIVLDSNLTMEPIISLVTYLNNEQMWGDPIGVLRNEVDSKAKMEKPTYVDMSYEIDPMVKLDSVEATFKSYNFVPIDAYITESGDNANKPVDNFSVTDNNDGTYKITFNAPSGLSASSNKKVTFRANLKNEKNPEGNLVDVRELFKPMKLDITKGLSISKENINNLYKNKKDLIFNGSVDVNVYGVYKSLSSGNYAYLVSNSKKSSNRLAIGFEKEEKNKPSTSGNGSSSSTPVCSCPIKKVYGKDRIETAIRIAEKYYGSANTVILAMKDQFPDSLTATVLSKQLNAPILLTETEKLNDSVAKEIKKLGATHVIIVGGPKSVSENVEKEVKEKFDKSAERIHGVDRYGTSEMVARRVVGITGKLNKAVVASGEVFPDALSISPFAASEGYPILLVRKNQVPRQIEKSIKDLEIKNSYLIGGNNTISVDTQKKLPKVIERMYGPTRYATAIEIAKTKFKDSTTAFLTSGEVFSDALVIGPVAGKYRAPVLLTPHNALDSLRTYIDGSNIRNIVAVGGPTYLPASIFYLLDK